MTAPVFAGLLPNVFHAGLSFEELRRSPTFTARPDTDSILLSSSPTSYRYVRQDDPLWGRLHAGMCTTGYIAAALGLFEQRAARRIGKKSRYIFYLHRLSQPKAPSFHLID